jgi:putative tricarboxylic transport membrane protein
VSQPRPLLEAFTMNPAKKDLVLGIILVLTFSLVFLVVIPAAVVVPGGIKISATAPDYWPKLISAAIALLGLAVLAQGIIGIKQNPTPPPGKEAAGNGENKNSGFFKTATAIIGLLAYYWLVIPLGIVAASMLALPGFAVIYGERRVKVLVPLALLLPMALYFFFTRVANIPMPLGIFE